MSDVREIADGRRDQVESAGHEAHINATAKDKGPGVCAEAFGRVNEQTTSGSQCGRLLREWNSSPPIVVVAIAVIATIVVVAAIVVITAIATVISEAVDAADVTQLLLNL